MTAAGAHPGSSPVPIEFSAWFAHITVATRDHGGRIEKCCWRYSRAGSTVTVHDHRGASVSIRCGPHMVGRYDSNRKSPAENNAIRPWKKRHPCKPWKTALRFPAAPAILWKSPPAIPIFPPPRTRFALSPQPAREISLNPKRTNRVLQIADTFKFKSCRQKTRISVNICQEGWQDILTAPIRRTTEIGKVPGGWDFQGGSLSPRGPATTPLSEEGGNRGRTRGEAGSLRTPWQDADAA